MEPQALLAFALAFFVFAASPGPDNMTIVARTVSHGASSGIAYGVGTVIGILIYLALAAFGLSLIASEMGLAMTVLRYAGAAWLIYMGIRLWTTNPVVAEVAAPERGRDLLTSASPRWRSISATRKYRSSTSLFCRISSVRISPSAAICRSPQSSSPSRRWWSGGMCGSPAAHGDC